MPTPFRVAVYCASAPGLNHIHRATASDLGAALAQAGMGLVYGGASVGLMGLVADAALAHGAEVIGVLPEILSSSEIAHPNLTQLIATASMQQRKATMIELSHAVIALPGGYGTLDELMEALTWLQLGIIRFPIILINTLGYYDHLLAFLDHAVASGFLKAKNRALIQIAPTPANAVQLLQQLRS